jgi:hypothetical protein
LIADNGADFTHIGVSGVTEEEELNQGRDEYDHPHPLVPKGLLDLFA